MFGGQLIGVDVGGTKVAVATLEEERLSESLVRPTEASSADELVDEIVAAVDAVRSRARSRSGSAFRRWSSSRPAGALERQPPPGRPRSAAGARGAPRAAGVRGQRRHRGGAGGGVRRRRASRSCRTWSCSRSAPGSVAGWCSGARLPGRDRGRRRARPHAGRRGPRPTACPAPGRFPQPGSLESLAAGRVLDRLAAKVADRSPSSALGKLAAEGRTVDGHDAVEAAQAGDPEAIAALRILGERLGIGIANALNTFDPDEVVVGGGVSSAGELLLGPATRGRAALRPARRRRAHRDPAGPPRAPGGRSRRRAAGRPGAGRGRRRPRGPAAGGGAQRERERPDGA